MIFMSINHYLFIFYVILYILSILNITKITISAPLAPKHTRCYQKSTFLSFSTTFCVFFIENITIITLQFISYPFQQSFYIISLLDTSQRLSFLEPRMRNGIMLDKLNIRDVSEVRFLSLSCKIVLFIVLFAVFSRTSERCYTSH